MAIKKRILIIEDEPDVVKGLHYYLRAKGYEVLTAGDGPGGLEMAQREKPDLVLLDVMIPHKDGYEVCREIKSTPGLKQAPVLLLTARAQPNDKARGREAGADEYVTKPFRLKELLLKIQGLLEKPALSGSAK